MWASPSPLRVSSVVNGQRQDRRIRAHGQARPPVPPSPRSGEGEGTDLSPASGVWYGVVSSAGRSMPYRHAEWKGGPLYGPVGGADGKPDRRSRASRHAGGI